MVKAELVGWQRKPVIPKPHVRAGWILVRSRSWAFQAENDSSPADQCCQALHCSHLITGPPGTRGNPWVGLAPQVQDIPWWRSESNPRVEQFDPPQRGIPGSSFPARRDGNSSIEPRGLIRAQDPPTQVLGAKSEFSNGRKWIGHRCSPALAPAGKGRLKPPAANRTVQRDF